MSSVAAKSNQFIRRKSVAIALGLLCGASVVSADNRTLECKLYIAEAVDHASGLALESSGGYLNALRRAGFCLFPDGSIADKQFVMGMNAMDGGATGDGVGISVYTFANGDSITLSFDLGWDSDGLLGKYQILRGTGEFEGATGSGQFTGAESPWSTTSVVDVRIDMSTSGS